MDLKATLQNLLAKSKPPPKSIFFYTMHNSEVGLLAELVFEHSPGLRHVDHASRIFTGLVSTQPDFHTEGVLYAPIRVSANRKSPEFALLVAPAITDRFLKGRRGFFFVRDPRDILISSFHSMKSPQKMSMVPGIRELQMERKKDVEEIGIDEFCLKQAPKVLHDFQVIAKLRKEAGAESTLLRYEDLFFDFEKVATVLRKVFELEKETMEKIRERVEELKAGDLEDEAHATRVPGNFRRALREDTLKALDGTLLTMLREFGYSEFARVRNWNPPTQKSKR